MVKINLYEDVKGVSTSLTHRPKFHNKLIKIMLAFTLNGILINLIVESDNEMISAISNCLYPSRYL